MVIRLFCAAGMSTSLLVKKMEEAAKEKGKDADIAAYPFTDMERMIEGVDVALLGPQVGYQLARAKEICDPKGVPVDVIPMQDYGCLLYTSNRLRRFGKKRFRKHLRQ